jgi:hypothetical protein
MSFLILQDLLLGQPDPIHRMFRLSCSLGMLAILDSQPVTKSAIGTRVNFPIMVSNQEK